MSRALTKILAVFMVFQAYLFAIGDLSPKYLRLFTNSEGKGVWQMVGVAGFYNNIYGIEYEEAQGQYTSFYCENNTSSSIIRTIISADDPKNTMQGKFWLFSVKVEREIAQLSPLVVDVSLSHIDCSGATTYGGTDIPTELLINTESSSETPIRFIYPNTGNTNSIVFSLNYDRIYDINLTTEALYNTLTLSPELEIPEDDPRRDEISVKIQPIGEIIDLYLNDNPGFGLADENYSAASRDSREYHTANNQVPIHESNFISDNSELKIWSYDSINNKWLEYNSKNTNTTNEFTDLQAGKGYWMKYDFNVNQNTIFLQTLDLNQGCGVGCESNLSIKSDAGNVRDYNFENSDVSSIVSDLNNTTINNGEVNISAIRISDNSVLIIANAQDKPKIFETTENKNVFLNLTSGEHTFWSSQEIKSGLVLGDSSVVLTDNSVYKVIATKGWNLLTLPSASIRKTVTGLIIDWTDADNDQDTFTITDEFGINKVVMAGVYSIKDKTASEAAQIINKAIYYAAHSGELSTSYFNVRAVPIGENNDKLLFISDDKFILETDGAFGNITNLYGDTKDLKGQNIVVGNKAYSNYGETAIFFRPNTESQFVKDGHAQIEINTTKINLTDENISKIVENINNRNLNVKAYLIDHDINGSINKDGSDYILLASKHEISLRDLTYTKVYSFTPNSEGTVLIQLMSGTDIDSKVKEIAVPKDGNLTDNNLTGEFNVSTENIYGYVIPDNSKNIEYILVSSVDKSTVILEEGVSESNVTEDSLKSIENFDLNVSSKGAILDGIQGNDFASFEINQTSGTLFLQNQITNITSVPFITDDLLSSNALITLSNAFSSTEEKLLPTMIIGSESNPDEGVIYWKTLSPVQKLDRWYENYNLFSTNNQKAYWVYLDSYDFGDSLIIDNAQIQKSYFRTFDNELNVTHNFYNITSLSVDITNQLQSDIYVVANLVGVPYNLEKVDFKMVADNAPLTADLKTQYLTSINYFDVEGLTNDLTSIDITATDGRLYTKKISMPIDVTKPAKPTLEFNAGGLVEPTKLYIKAGDTEDTVMYRVYKDRINDIDGGSQNPATWLLDIQKDAGEVGVDDICKHSLFANSTNLQAVNLVVVALDNEDISQANFSDMAKITYVPMQNVHVLVHDAAAGGKATTPTLYNNECVNGGQVQDGGVSLTSYNGVISMVYKPLNTTTSNEVPLSIFVTIPGRTEAIAKVSYKQIFVGKNFYIAFNNKIYEGVFLNETTQRSYDNEQNPYVLKEISNSGQDFNIQ